jgi:hypothetical protein
MVGSYEHGNEPSGSIKSKKFPYWLSDLASQGLCSMDIVS